MTIDELLDKEGFNETCDECRFYSSWTENHGPGLHEHLAECTADDDTLCPRLEDI